MGNSQTCVDCNTNVPRKVKWLDNIKGNMGRRFCKLVDNETWIKLGSNKYLCSSCLTKRQNHERQKQQEEERRRENEKGQERKNDREQENRQTLNEKKDQLLLSETRLSNWEKKEKQTIHEVEHSQIIEKSLVRRVYDYCNLSSLPFQNNSNPKKQINAPCNVVVQKDDKSVLQEMIDAGDISEAEGRIISNVLLTVQKKIKSYDRRNMFNPKKILPNYELFSWFKTVNFIDREKEFIQCIFEISLAVKLTKTYWPRNTQIISFCLLVKAKQKGILLEINTGEGKTCIIAMFSAFLALSQIAVDIVSSSPILAQRDYIEWKEFFKLLNVSVSCNLIPKKTDERLRCYSKKVVYGTVGSFASDLLRQTFLMENVRGKRMCDAVIVDEVDCMLLDQGVNYTYLSHAIPGMHHIEPVLFMIWKHIVKHEKIVSDQSENFFLGVLDSFQVVLSSYIDLSDFSKETNIPPEIQLLYLLEKNYHLTAGFINDVLKGNHAEFKRIFTEEKLLECLEFVETIFPITFRPFVIQNDNTVKAVEEWGSLSKTPNDKKIHLLIVKEGLLCVLHPYTDEKEVHDFVKNEIKNFISFDGCKPNKHYIPAYLEGFVENRLTSWIENAFTANHMANGREYLVKDNDVVPVDFESTGVVQLDTKWGDCLHQFLEIKHGKKLSHITLVTNFMSNQEYFRRYMGKIFGVSGTLGTAREKSFLTRQFKLRCQKIPTHRSKIFKELPGIICDTKSKWIIAIQDIVRDQVANTSDDKQRAVLVVCEDINTAEKLKNKLTENVSDSVALYIRNDENDDKIDRTLKAGDIIVATNIAGRGTDIVIDESVEKAGGLFVLVTFLPQNTRIENQVFGRSARKGQPGSAQIVLNRHCLPKYFSLYGFTDIESLKHLRDAMEEQSIVDIEKHAFAEVQLKEKLFACYCSFLFEIKQQLNFSGIDEKIMLDSLHEYWGMWLKINYKTGVNLSRSEDLQSLLCDNLKTAKNKILENNSPCSNISHIIKFANDQLFDKKYALSEKLFTRAIEEDIKWGAIAYYNRAYCFLLKRDKGYINKAIDDLSKSQKCFQLFKEEAVLCLTLSSSRKDEHNDEYKINGTASQFYSRCQIINHFEDNIQVAIQQLKELQTQNKEATAEGCSIFSIALGDDNTSKTIETEIYLFWEMGLTELIFVKERKPFCWKGMLVAALGVLQIAVGTIIIASTTGMLTQLGWGLIAEGVNDICTGAFAVWKRDQKFMKSWMIGKAVSVAISVATFGYNQAKSAAEGVRGVKATVEAASQRLTQGAEMLVSEFKAMGSMVTSQSFGPIFKTTCVEVGKEVGLQLAKRTGKYLLEVVQEKVKIYFDGIAEERIKQETQLAFSEGVTNAMIDDFISFHCKINTPTDQICNKYMEITKKLFYSGNTHIRQFRQVLVGCVKDVIKTLSVQLETHDFIQCKPIFDIINGIACASYDVKQLVSIYCNHVKTALDEIYTDSFTNEASGYSMEVITDLCIIRQQIIDQTAQFLFGLLKDSFEFTGSGILAEKLQIAVGKFVSESSDANNVDKETKLGKIIALSSKAGKISIDLATKRTLDVKTVVETGFDVAESVVDVVAEGETKKIIGFGLRTTKTSIQALQSGQTCEIIDATIDIASDGINTFADEEIKPKANFVLNGTKKGVKIIQSGKTEEIIDAVIDIATDGIDKFADDDIKPKANFVLNATKKGVKALQSGKTEDIFDAVIDIASDGIDKFTDEDIQPIANFTLDATKKGVKVLQSGKTEDIIDAVIDITSEGIDKFGDEDIQPIANFTLDATKKGVKALKSGKTEDIIDAVIDIASDGIDKFVDEDIQPIANFTLDATTKGVKALKSGKTEDIIDAVIDIASDGIDKFADEDIQPIANFTLDATKKGVKALQSGKTEDIIDAVIDIASDGIDKFADEDIHPIANFTLDASKKGVKALQSGKTEDIIDAVIDIASDGIDKFADEDIQPIANFTLDATKQGVKALQSGKTEDIFNAVIDIASDGIDKFVDEDIQPIANFTLDASKKGVKALQSGKTEDIIDAVIDIASDGIDKFADEDIQPIATFTLDATKKGVKALQSGKN